jgi:hypothetical protein
MNGGYIILPNLVNIRKKQDIFIYDESCIIFVFFYFHVMGEQPNYLKKLFSKE